MPKKNKKKNQDQFTLLARYGGRFLGVLILLVIIQTDAQIQPGWFIWVWLFISALLTI